MPENVLVDSFGRSESETQSTGYYSCIWTCISAFMSGLDSKGYESDVLVIIGVCKAENGLAKY